MIIVLPCHGKRDYSEYKPKMLSENIIIFRKTEIQSLLYAATNPNSSTTSPPDNTHTSLLFLSVTCQVTYDVDITVTSVVSLQRMFHLKMC